ncbi:hypothetical protein LOD99_5418 [Oopsacas minuta]|uniref:Uncharacterized protein n=1 Tax=Oopsacas minuta TaxID=111878 RepID=A0AAV7JRG4_9METZ|nr:hypothetical protein LOD99_5418 [Oopsacas minuta]
MKQLVTSLDKYGPCFKWICRSFQAMRNEKLKAGIFNGRQIRRLIRNTGFVQCLTNLESSTWYAFALVGNNFLDNSKANNYIDLVNDIFYKKDLDVNMSIKIHHLFSHLDRFHVNLGDLSEEQGEMVSSGHQGHWREILRQVRNPHDGRLLL